MLERQSAIASGVAGGSRLRDGAAGVRLGEVRGWGMLQVAGFRGGMAPVEQALEAASGMAASIYIGEARQSGSITVLRTGPEQIWVVYAGYQPALEGAIRARVGAAAGLVLSLSHSRTRMFIEGPKARDVLAKEIALDLDPSAFAIDRFALTGFDDTPVLLHRIAVDRYEFYAMRTFALTVWERLADAALEFGYESAV